MPTPIDRDFAALHELGIHDLAPSAFAQKRCAHAKAPPVVSDFEVQQLISVNRKQLTHDESIGIGSGLAVVIAPYTGPAIVKLADDGTLPVHGSCGGGLELMPYGPGIRKVKGTTTGGVGGMEQQAETAGESSNTARRRRSSSEENEPSSRQRTLSPPMPLTGLDPRAMQALSALLINFLEGLAPERQQRLAQRFDQLHVREENIAEFRGPDADLTGIVNDANSMLCPPGECRVSPGGELPAGNVIHAVGPRDGDERTLRNAYRNSYRARRQLNLQHLAVSPLSTGVHGYPTEPGTWVMVEEALSELASHGRRQTLRLQLTSCSPHGTDRNFTAIAHYWRVARDWLRANVDPQLDGTPPVPRDITSGGIASTGTGRARPLAPGARGRYRIEAPHLSQRVRTYYPPQPDGYHHEVQERGDTSCGLHVLNQGLMLYGGNDADLLASQDAVDAHIAALVDGTGLTPQRHADRIRARQTRYEFSDLSSFTQSAQGGLPFDAVQGASYFADRAFGARFVLPGNSPVTLNDIDGLHWLGVTYHLRTRTGDEAEHSTSILQLRTGQFIEVDPRRDPRVRRPAQLQGATMSLALESLLTLPDRAVEQQFVVNGVAHNMGRNFDLLTASAELLDAYDDGGLQLPQQPVLPPLAPIRLTRRRRDDDAEPTDPRSANPEGSRPGVDEVDTSWVGAFIGDDEGTQGFERDIQRPPPQVPLVEHYGRVLWRRVRLLTQPLHFVRGEDEALALFARNFGGAQLLVTYNQLDAGDGSGSPPERTPITSLLLEREDGWDCLDADGERLPLEQSLADCLRAQLAEADEDGLRLLRRAPSGDESLLQARMHDRALGKDQKWDGQARRLLDHLEVNGVTLASLHLGEGYLFSPTDSELERLLASMFIRGALTDMPLFADLTGHMRVSVVERRRQIRELNELAAEAARLELLLQRGADGALENAEALRDIEQRIHAGIEALATGQRGALRQLLQRAAPDGRLRLDLNEFVLLLPPQISQETLALTATPAQPHTRVRPRPGGVPGLSDGRRASDMYLARHLPSFVLRNSLAVKGAARLEARYQGGNQKPKGYQPPFVLHRVVLRRYREGLLDAAERGELDQRSLQVLYSSGNALLRRLAHAVAPMSSDPLATDYAPHLLNRHLNDLMGNDQAQDIQGLLPWLDAHLDEARRLADEPGAGLPLVFESIIAPARLRLSRPDELTPEHLVAARSACAVLQMDPVLHPGDTAVAYLATLLSHYERFLRGLQTTVLPAAVLAVASAADITRTMRAFGLPTVNEAADRAYLQQLMRTPPAPGTAHQLQLSLVRFQRLTVHLQTFMIDRITAASGGNERIAYNRVHGTALQGSRVMPSYRPQVTVHLELMALLEEREPPPTDRDVAFLRRAIYTLEVDLWEAGNPVTLFDVAMEADHVPDALVAALERAMVGEPAAFEVNWTHLKEWVGDQEIDAERPLLPRNDDMLTAYMEAIDDDEERGDAFEVLGGWMRDREASATEVFDNPVWNDLLLAGEDEELLIQIANTDAELATGDGLTADEERHLRDFHAFFGQMMRESDDDQAQDGDGDGDGDDADADADDEPEA